MYRLNNLKTSTTDTVLGWHFDLTNGPWNDGNLGSCDSGPWFGFKTGELIGSISTTLYGQGHASLTFGNCWDTGIVKLFLNESEISSVGPHSQKTVGFYFDNTIMKVEEHDTGIIQFFHFEISGCIIVGDEDFCSSINPCEEDQGDCDNNNECQNNLVCGTNNCPDSLGFEAEVDCCYNANHGKPIYYMSPGSSINIPI